MNNKQNKTTIPQPLLDPLVKKDVNSELVRFVFCLLGAIFTYILVAFCVVKSYHPDIQAMIDAAQRVSFLSDFQPEPVEALLFRLAVLIFPFSLLFFYWLSRKSFLDKLSNQKILPVIVSVVAFAAIAALTYYVFSRSNPTFVELTDGKVYNEHDKVSDTNFVFYFMNLFLQNKLLLYSLLIVPLLLCFYLFAIQRMKGKWLMGWNIFVSCLGYAFSALLIFQVIKMNSFDMPLNWQNQYDFNAIFYSMTQVNAGSQLLVDNFTNTYGLYPHFLYPVFKICGFSVAHFTLVMALLVALCFVSAFVFMRTFTNDKLMLILFFTSLFLLPYFQTRFVTDFDAVFAMFPIRMICPSLVLLGVSLFHIAKKRNSKLCSTILYWLVMLFAAFGILWNFEFGVVAFLSWLLYLSYSDFYDDQSKFNWKKILYHWAVGILSVVFAFVVYALIQYLIYGSFPNYRMMLEVLTMFGQYGYFMLPMSLWHPWMLVALVYLVSMLYAIAKLVKKEISPKSAAIFLVAILGVGLFAYYQGRSHNSNLSVVMFFAFINLSLLADELWESYKKSHSFALLPFFYVVLFCCAFSVIDLLANSEKISNLASHRPEYKELKASIKQEERKIQSNIDFIDSCDVTTSKILLFTSNKYQGLYMTNPRMRSAVNPGILDMFYKDDVEKYVRVLEDSLFNVFMDPYGFYYDHCADIRAVVAMDYEVLSYKADSTFMDFAFMKKREEQMPTVSYMKEDNSTIFHKKFTTTAEGNAERIAFAKNGVENIHIPSDFTVEVLFYPDSFQLYVGSCLIGNFTDTSGFQISKTGDCNDKSSYFFGIHSLGITCSLTPNQWHYLVMVVSGDIVAVYDNGALLDFYPFGYKYSDKGTTNLFVGNHREYRNFSGLISEIRISKGVISMGTINETVRNIK